LGRRCRVKAVVEESSESHAIVRGWQRDKFEVVKNSNAGAVGVEGKEHHRRSGAGAAHGWDGGLEEEGIVGDGLPVGDQGADFAEGGPVMIAKVVDHMAT
jgi:hypothetical protein